MDDDDDDVHFCIMCNNTFQGLDLYIAHRQNECESRQIKETLSVFPQSGDKSHDVYEKSSSENEFDSSIETIKYTKPATTDQSKKKANSSKRRVQDLKDTETTPNQRKNNVKNKRKSQNIANHKTSKKVRKSDAKISTNKKQSCTIREGHTLNDFNIINKPKQEPPDDFTTITGDKDNADKIVKNINTGGKSSGVEINSNTALSSAVDEVKNSDSETASAYIKKRTDTEDKKEDNEAPAVEERSAIQKRKAIAFVTSNKRNRKDPSTKVLKSALPPKKSGQAVKKLWSCEACQVSFDTFTELTAHSQSLEHLEISVKGRSAQLGSPLSSVQENSLDALSDSNDQQCIGTLSLACVNNIKEEVESDVEEPLSQLHSPQSSVQENSLGAISNGRELVSNENSRLTYGHDQQSDENSRLTYGHDQQSDENSRLTDGHDQQSDENSRLTNDHDQSIEDSQQTDIVVIKKEKATETKEKSTERRSPRSTRKTKTSKSPGTELKYHGEEDTDNIPVTAFEVLKDKKGTSIKGYKCRVGNCRFKALKLNEYNLHYKSEHGPKFHCKLCNYSTDKRIYFNRHLKRGRHKKISSDNAVNERTSDTEDNEEKEETEVELSENDISSDKPDGLENSRHDIPTENANDSISDGQFLYSDISLLFTDKDSQTSHSMSITFNKPQPQASGLSNKNQLKYAAKKHRKFVRSLPEDPDIIVTCPECNQCVLRLAIVDHLQTHIDIRPFKCNLCTHSFIKEPQLRSHVTRYHVPSQSDKYKCIHCGNCLFDKIGLKEHMLRKHRDKIDFVPEFICLVCGREFATCTKYKSHLRSHANENRFSCSFPDCKHRYKTESELKYHERKHTKEKPYLCEICGFQASWSSHMAKHRKSHFEDELIRCEYCSFKCTRGDNLIRHMRIHTASKAYLCPQCDYKTTDISRLRKHVERSKSHKGLLLCKCNLCKERFDYANELKFHLRSAHNLYLSKTQALELAGIYDKSLDDVGFLSDKDTSTPLAGVTHSTVEVPAYLINKVIATNVQVVPPAADGSTVSDAEIVPNLFDGVSLNNFDMVNSPLQTIAVTDEMEFEPVQSAICI